MKLRNSWGFPTRFLVAQWKKSAKVNLITSADVTDGHRRPTETGKMIHSYVINSINL